MIHARELRYVARKRAEFLAKLGISEDSDEHRAIENVCVILADRIENVLEALEGSGVPDAQDIVRRAVAVLLNDIESVISLADIPIEELYTPEELEKGISKLIRDAEAER